ncbi:hypothetical protein [Hymenobacter psychrophilus]|uniref:Transposase n=1 Tax=Hymenobacter psychrophilus TaxID=651662 RepID=A0A1H3CK95_9BACT|nr:hypothetical protein [Hymenobacter psychrophilus]SDX54525.1 hypothetical protein SAMN04488069_10221 [Hymenobacter psychrophilus]
MGKLDKYRRYDVAFHTQTLRMVAESHKTSVAACALNLDPKLVYGGSATPALPAEALEERQLRAANRRLEQELEISKKPSSFFGHPTGAMSCYPSYRSVTG